MPKKPKIVGVGNTPVTPITTKERRKLHKLMKKRLDMRRRKVPRSTRQGRRLHQPFHTTMEYFASMSASRIRLCSSFRFACDMFIVGADLIYTHTPAEAERDAAIALEMAIYGDLFPVVLNIEDSNNFPALN